MADKNRLQIVAQETDRILAAGCYVNSLGSHVDLAPILAAQRAGTVLYEPSAAITVRSASPGAMAMSLVGITAIEAILTAGDGPDNPCCLVFASARRPGGGYQSGADAQEESIARASTLASSLHATPDFYERHKASRDLTYSDSAIYTPHAAVFRDNHGQLLDRPIRCAFITAAAPNAKAMAASQRHDLGKVPQIIARRINRVLDIAADRGHRHLILGAWGCGVFGLDAGVVAGSFAAALAERPWFDTVTFAVPYMNSGHYHAFSAHFG